MSQNEKDFIKSKLEKRLQISTKRKENKEKLIEDYLIKLRKEKC